MKIKPFQNTFIINQAGYSSWENFSMNLRDQAKTAIFIYKLAFLSVDFKQFLVKTRMLHIRN